MFNLDDDIMRQLKATFQVEAAEHIQAMNRALLALEENPAGAERPALLEEIFREAHSLKGAAGAADFPQVEGTAHKLESAFGAAKSGKVQLTRDVCDVLYAGIDAVAVIVGAAFEETPHGVDLAALHARLEQVIDGSDAQHGWATTLSTTPFETISKPEERKKTASTGQGFEDTIRVATAKVDSLMTQSGELLVAGLKIDQRLNEVKEINRLLEEWNRESLKARAGNGNGQAQSADRMRTVTKLLDLNQEKLRVISNQVTDLQRGLARDALHLSRVINNLGEGVMKVRMLPLATLFDTLPRLVRDVARECNKEVELQTEGAETELDRKVLEEIKDPLMHLLRNSLDHGIESPDERVEAGKPRTGTITVKAFQKANTIVLQVSDDGAGINRERVKDKAIAAGLIGDAEAETLSDDETLRLIFSPGLSTSATVTQLSGRGVGMDVVRKNVEALQGQVDIDSTLGSGTTITLTLPLTLATTQVLLAQVGDQTYGIPISAVERILRIQPSAISKVAGRPAIVVDSEPVSLARLAEVLERPPSEAPTKNGESVRMPVVILRSGKNRIAFLVDDVVGQQEMVVKSLGKQLARVRNVAGATILGSGRVMMTLNPVDLLKAARQAKGKAAAAPRAAATAASVKQPKRKTVLVADDSLSTRTLEKNILETAGYKVLVAADGMEALSILNSSGGCDLIVSDVLMPCMTGIELTAAVRKDSKLKKIPVILVTSLDSREDKERGIEVGADAYIVKSNFDQSNLLQTIAQLI